MLALLRFLHLLEYEIYALLALGVLASLRRIALARGGMRKTIFGLERESLVSRQTRASLTIVMLGFAGGSLYAAVHLALPNLERAELVRTTGSSEPLPTPSPTAFVLFGVDLSGCVNPRATITSPTPGQAVQGEVQLRGSANIDQFAFYKYELSNPEAGDVWVTLAASNTPVTEDVLGTWDSSTVPPGVYHLRLIVTDSQGNSPRSCIVPVQVLATPLG
jgi:hypothetical protein